MNMKQMIAEAKATSPTLAGLPEDVARELLLVVFRLVRRAVNAAQAGEVSVGGLGVFSIQQGERDKDGRKVTVRRVGFQVATGPARRGPPVAKKVAAKKVAAKKVAAKKVAAKKVAAKKVAAKKVTPTQG